MESLPILKVDWGSWSLP